MASIFLLHCSFLSVASDVWRLPLTARVGACRVIVSYSQPIRFVRVDLGHEQWQELRESRNSGVGPFQRSTRRSQFWCWPKGARSLGTRMIFLYSPSFYMAEHFTSNMEPLVRTYFTRSWHFAWKPLAFPSVLVQITLISANKQFGSDQILNEARLMKSFGVWTDWLVLVTGSVSWRSRAMELELKNGFQTL